MCPERYTVAEVLRCRRQRGEHPLLICDDERISYAGTDRRSAELARGLIALGAGKGTHVGLWYPNGVDFVVGMLAAARIGAVVVPFSTFVTASELRTQLVSSDTSIMLAAAAYRSHDYVHRMHQALDTGAGEFDPRATLFTENAPALRHVVFDTDALVRLGEPVAEPLLAAMEADVDPSDALAIVYTSGSTGPPKGAVHTHASLIGHQRNLNEIRSLAADDKLFSNSPFFWIGGFAFGLLATLIAGATLVCSNATDPGVTLDLIDAEQPNVTNGFAAAIAHLTRHPSFAGRHLTAQRGNLYPIMAPEARPADIALRHNMLGMTEAGSVLLISGDEGDQPEHRRGSYGRPAPGFDIKVIEQQTGVPLAVGEIGELCIRGPYVMQGYYGRSREECFDADGWFHTGDLVRTDDDGFCYFVTRAGSMIKSAGANVTPAEVERALRNVLADIGGEVTVHVLGLPDAARGQMVAAVIALDDYHFDEAHFDEAAVRRKLKAELSAYKVPKVFVTCRRADIPLLSSGKVDMAGLAKLFDD
jgi:acyl-CoA synthetase (AMP-forming)/AMP-acid ligase II